MGSETIDAVFIIFASNYKQLFTKDLENENAEWIIKSNWIKNLNDFDSVDIIDSASEWTASQSFPPKLNEFIALVRQKKNRRTESKTTEISHMQKQIDHKSWTQSESINIKNIMSKAITSSMGRPLESKWDELKTNPNHPSFDGKIYNEKREYLINMHENDVINLSGGDFMDRRSFLMQIEWDRMHPNYRPYAQQESQETRSYSSPRNIVKFNRD